MKIFADFNKELNVNNAPAGKLGDMAVIFNNDAYEPHRGYQMMTWTYKGQGHEGWSSIEAYETFKKPFAALIEYGYVKPHPTYSGRWRFHPDFISLPAA